MPQELGRSEVSTLFGSLRFCLCGSAAFRQAYDCLRWPEIMKNPLSSNPRRKALTSQYAYLLHS